MILRNLDLNSRESKEDDMETIIKYNLLHMGHQEKKETRGDCSKVNSWN